MAVGAGDAPLAMNALQGGFITGMLGLEDGRLREGVDVVRVAHFVIILFSILQRETVFPGEGKVLVLFGRFRIIMEIILYVALGADQRTHLVVRGLVHVLSHAGKSLAQGRTGDMQVHRLAVVAVRAADGVHHLGTPPGPVGLVELGRTHFLHQARHVRALAGPAGTGLIGTVVQRGGGTGAQDLAMIFQCVEVAAGRIVVPGEGIPSPEDNHIRTLSQDILNIRRHILGTEIRLLGGLPGFILAREIALELLVLSHDALHRILAVVEDARHLGSAFHQGGNHESEEEDDDHGAAENQPAVQGFEFVFAHISILFIFRVNGRGANGARWLSAAIREPENPGREPWRQALPKGCSFHRAGHPGGSPSRPCLRRPVSS